jgi:hypothetical protein
MQPGLIEKRPSWWLLYVLAAVMVGLVALVETSVPYELTRVTLEVVIVVMISALMLRWLHANRGRIELAEAPRTSAVGDIKIASKSSRRRATSIGLAPGEAPVAVHSISPWPSAGPIPTSSSFASENRRRAGRAAS